MLSFSSKGKHSAMSDRSLLRRKQWEQLREVKVVIFCEKTRKPFEGKGKEPTPVILSDVSFFNGKQEIVQRRLLRSWLSFNDERLRYLRLVNLSRRRPRKGSVPFLKKIENRRRSVIEKNCLDTRNKEFKSSLAMNLKIHSQHSLGRSKCVAATVSCEFLIVS